MASRSSGICYILDGRTDWTFSRPVGLSRSAISPLRLPVTSKGIAGTRVYSAGERDLVPLLGGRRYRLSESLRHRPRRELKHQLVRAAIGASDALRAELPGVRLGFARAGNSHCGRSRAPGRRTTGRGVPFGDVRGVGHVGRPAQPELGGHEKYLDVIGVNYYDRNQWWNHGPTIRRNEPAYRPFREILAEVYHRYRRPMFISETGTEDDDRPAWLALRRGRSRAAMQAGIPLHGICLYPILNHPGWDDDRHCRNGLWDYPGPGGEREIFSRWREGIRRQQDRERKQL